MRARIADRPLRFFCHLKNRSRLFIALHQTREFRIDLEGLFERHGRIFGDKSRNFIHFRQRNI